MKQLAVGTVFIFYYEQFNNYITDRAWERITVRSMVPLPFSLVVLGAFISEPGDGFLGECVQEVVVILAIRQSMINKEQIFLGQKIF